VIKGAGMQGVGGPVVLFSYYVVGLPAAVYMAFDLHGRGLRLGVTGLCLGTAIGTWMHMLIFLVITRRVDWKEEARTAHLKLGTKAGGRGSGSGRGRGNDDRAYLPLNVREEEEEEENDEYEAEKEEEEEGGSMEMGAVHMNVISLYDDQEFSWTSP
jgi:hypothetical protein